jgi:serine/threonine protein phosphatase PrpC
LVEGVAEAEEITAGLDECLKLANTRIHQRGLDEAEHRGMGTTMTAAFVSGDTVHLAQVGDSRGYLLRKNKLVQLTKDQSLISQLIEDGTLTEEEAEKLGGRNIILQALGVEPDVNVEVKSMELLDGDLLMLCSDGLTGMVKDSMLEETLVAADDLGAAGERLIHMANDAGGRDNITVILARFEGSGLRAPMKAVGGEKKVGATRKSVERFVAPEPPQAEPRRSKSRFLLLGGIGIIVLAVILFLVSGGSSKVTLIFPGPGGTATLTPADGKGEGIVVKAEPGETRVVVRDMKPGSYVLEARLDHYQPLIGRPISVSQGASDLVVPLVPLPGSLELTSETPHVNVEILELEPLEPDHSYRELVENLVSGKSVPRVPAGSIKLTVSREGFLPSDLTVDLSPEGSETVVLEELEPIIGILVVSCSVAGASVTVQDEYGDEIASKLVPEGGGALEIEVRVGKLRSVKVTHAEHHPREQVVSVGKGERVPLEVELIQMDGSVTVTGPRDALLSFKLKGSDRVVRRSDIGPDGSVTVSLPPGTYTVEMIAGDVTDHREVKVSATTESNVRFNE